MICPQCRGDGLREQAQIFVDAPAGSTYDKASVRRAVVKVQGAKRTLIYCPSCGYRIELNQAVRTARVAEMKNPHER